MNESAQSTEAEMVVRGVMLLDRNDAFDIVTVKDELRRMSQQSAAGDVRYLSELTIRASSAASTNCCARIVLEALLDRDIDKLLSRSYYELYYNQH